MRLCLQKPTSKSNCVATTTANENPLQTKGDYAERLEVNIPREKKNGERHTLHDLTHEIVTKPNLQRGVEPVVIRDREVEIERFGAKGIQIN